MLRDVFYLIYKALVFIAKNKKKKLRLVISVNGARTVRKRGIDNIKFNCGV